MRSASPALRTLVTTGALLLAPVPGGEALAQDITKRHEYMEYIDVVEDMVTYVWSVDLRNDSPEPLRLQIIFHVLDDDGGPLNVDEQGNPNDFMIVTIAGGTEVPIEQQGSLSYDLAAEIVTYEFRWKIIQAPD